MPFTFNNIQPKQLKVRKTMIDIQIEIQCDAKTENW